LLGRVTGKPKLHDTLKTYSFDALGNLECGGLWAPRSLWWGCVRIDKTLPNEAVRALVFQV